MLADRSARSSDSQCRSRRIRPGGTNKELSLRYVHLAMIAVQINLFTACKIESANSLLTLVWARRVNNTTRIGIQCSRLDGTRFDHYRCKRDTFTEN